MKIKELPTSFFHSFRLRYTRVGDKGQRIPVIVSLTSIPSRLASLDIVIKSLFDQSSPPNLIILWLNHALKNDVPEQLKQLQGKYFEIRYCEGSSSYRKLLPSLKAYPESTIVTCDDDLIYPENWLSNLYKAHKEHPGLVVSQVARIISRDENKRLKAYKAWPFIRYESQNNHLLPIGFGGVLYPPNTFTEEVFNESLYMSLSPRADDLWFKAMSYLNNKQTYCASEKARPIPIMRTQKVSLGKKNIGADMNKKQWQALCDHFPALRKLGSHDAKHV